ncbi:MAG: hypothetical protein PVG27_01235 [Chloroflexota bacterium]
MALVAAALTLTLSIPVLGADEQPLATIKGKKFRMADAKMADTVTRFLDEDDDPTRLDGTPEPDAPRWSDIKQVYVAPTRTPPKLLTKMNSRYPPGTVGALYGGDRDPGYKDRVVFVAVRMAKRMPGDSMGQQVEIGFSGNEATPVQNGTEHTTWAGTERFTLAGLFSDGAFAAGATDVSGRQPGLELEDDEYYDAKSGAFGFYRPKTATWYLVLPRAADTDAITVSVRSSTDVGSVIDRLELPGGGHFVDLSDPTGGWKPKPGLAPLSCRSLETFNGESDTIEGLGIDANLVRYTAGIETTADPAEAQELLGTAIEAVGPVTVALSEPGSEAQPLIVDGDLALTTDGNAVTLTFEAPEGQWVFRLAGGLELKTPAGEDVVDHMSLTGPAGVQVGPGLDGYVAGDLSCAFPDAGDDAAAGDDDAEGSGPDATAEASAPEGSVPEAGVEETGAQG